MQLVTILAQNGVASCKVGNVEIEFGVAKARRRSNPLSEMAAIAEQHDAWQHATPPEDLNPFGDESESE